jgi:uncharacterized protein (DUF488 family)
MTIYTVGYERRELDEFVALLGAAGIERVVDVRDLPLSRRKGFSKTPLAAALAEHDIEYVHLRAAGNPHRKDDASGAEIIRRYRAHVRRSPEIVDQVLAATAGKRSALLCLEREPAACHRGVLAGELARRGHAVEHLGALGGC